MSDWFEGWLRERGIPKPRCISFVEIGWRPLLSRLWNELVENGFDIGTDAVLQIKEKFGRLCFYVQVGGDRSRVEKLRNIIYRYQEESARVCEYCGSSASRRIINGHVSTLCDNCYSGERVKHDEV